MVEPSDDDGFDYPQYLRRQGIFAIMYSPVIRSLIRTRATRSWRRSIREGSPQSALADYIPEPEASLVQGILLGVRATFSTQLTRPLQTVGLTHIVVVSGYNLTVVATILLALAQKRLRGNLAMVIAVTGVVVSPSCRAQRLQSCAPPSWSAWPFWPGHRARKRRPDGCSLRRGAACRVRPLTLWDVSFQLSFLATIGLVLLSPPLERALGRLPLAAGLSWRQRSGADHDTPSHRPELPAYLAYQPAGESACAAGHPTDDGGGAHRALAGLTGHVVVRVAMLA